jgi:predicted DNA-binding transcriptional regulator AlpA
MDVVAMLPLSLPERLRTTQLAEALGVDSRTVLRMVTRGDLPAPVSLSPRLRVFQTSAIREALRQRQSPLPTTK